MVSFGQFFLFLFCINFFFFPENGFQSFHSVTNVTL
uniref:Uncharacterized protein n=1 Tax=Rhizophora mucronata TaxID=61149 RepID=A0A2P2ND79_RHIMU